MKFLISQIKSRILKLTFRRGQTTICIVLISVYLAENDCYRVVLAGELQLGFDSRTYCGRSCRMQGKHKVGDLALFQPCNQLLEVSLRKHARVFFKDGLRGLGRPKVCKTTRSPPYSLGNASLCWRAAGSAPTG